MHVKWHDALTMSRDLIFQKEASVSPLGGPVTDRLWGNGLSFPTRDMSKCCPSAFRMILNIIQNRRTERGVRALDGWWMVDGRGVVMNQ